MSLGTPQHIAYQQYLDCARRTKKQVNVTNDDSLVYFMLDTCSIADGGNRSFTATMNMMDLINHRLCPGQWCTRFHCKCNSNRHAYNCNKTRPSVCKSYKEYIRKKEIRDSKNQQEEQ